MEKRQVFLTEFQAILLIQKVEPNSPSVHSLASPVWAIFSNLLQKNRGEKVTYGEETGKSYLG